MCLYDFFEQDVMVSFRAGNRNKPLNARRHLNNRQALLILASIETVVARTADAGEEARIYLQEDLVLLVRAEVLGRWGLQ